MKGLMAMLSWAISPFSAQAQNAQTPSEEFQKFLNAHLQGAPLMSGRIQLSIPRLADNGHSVPLKISIDSPMTQDDHVKMLLILSPRNPRPLVSKMFFSPRQTKLNIATRVRLNGSQSIWVYAQMSDQSWYAQSAEVEVTESACLDAS